jgi:hypothetical protein
MPVLFLIANAPLLAFRNLNFPDIEIDYLTQT